MTQKLPLSELEVPSDTSVVSVSRLKEFLHALPQLGREFTREAAERMDGIPSGTPLARLLSYVKYLGLLDERRVRSDRGESSIQRYSVTDVGARLYYYLEARRTEKFESLWARHLRNHPVFDVVYQHKLAEHPTLTLHELQDFVYEAKDRDVSARYARKGAKFLAKLYADAGLVEYDNNKIRLVRNGEARQGGTQVPESSGPDSPASKHGWQDQNLHLPEASPKKIRESPSTPSSHQPREGEISKEEEGAMEEYRSPGVYIRILPKPKNIEKARRFLELVDLELD